MTAGSEAAKIRELLTGYGVAAASDYLVPWMAAHGYTLQNLRALTRDLKRNDPDSQGQLIARLICEWQVPDSQLLFPFYEPSKKKIQ